MERNISSWVPWRLFDGSIALSISMVLAALLKIWEDAVNWPVLGLLHQMTQWEDGVIIVATILLFPTALTLYGGFAMIFAAKATVDEWARRRAERQREATLKQERDRIRKALGARREPITMAELSSILDGESDNG